jgi:hypothetical protein
VHRNVANIVVPGDPNCTAVLQYAIGGPARRARHRLRPLSAAAASEAALGAPSSTARSSAGSHRSAAVAAAHASELDAIPDADARGLRLDGAERRRAGRVGDARRGGAGGVAAGGRSLAVHGWIYDRARRVAAGPGVTVAGLRQVGRWRRAGDACRAQCSAETASVERVTEIVAGLSRCRRVRAGATDAREPGPCASDRRSAKRSDERCSPPRSIASR